MRGRRDGRLGRWRLYGRVRGVCCEGLSWSDGGCGRLSPRERDLAGDPRACERGDSSLVGRLLRLEGVDVLVDRREQTLLVGEAAGDRLPLRAQPRECLFAFEVLAVERGLGVHDLPAVAFCLLCDRCVLGREDADSFEPVDQIGDAGCAGEDGKVIRGRRLVQLAQPLLDPDLCAGKVRVRDAKADLVRAELRVDATETDAGAVPCLHDTVEAGVDRRHLRVHHSLALALRLQSRRCGSRRRAGESDKEYRDETSRAHSGWVQVPADAGDNGDLTRSQTTIQARAGVGRCALFQSLQDHELRVRTLASRTRGSRWR